MGGKKDLGLTVPSGISWREQAARLTVRNARAQGHTYVELREESKKAIFFCALCQSPCFNEGVLTDHLKGNSHAKKLNIAKATLFASNRWPFNDGVLFFDTESCEENEENGNEHLRIADTGLSSLLETNGSSDNLAIVKHSVNGDSEVDPNGDGDIILSIPGVLVKDEITCLGLKFQGLGQVSARFREKDEVSDEMVKIWCEWLGEKCTADDDVYYVPDHDYAIITFKYNYELGMMSFVEDLKDLLASHSMRRIENGDGSVKKRKKSFSDSEGDVIDCLDTMMPSPRSLLDDEALQKQFITSKTVRRELRKKQSVASKELCDICQVNMLDGKDVSTILNMKMDRLVCSSRNTTGAFHLFHTSCLIHWILLCEYETYMNEAASKKVVQTPKRRKTSRKGRKKKNVGEAVQPKGLVNEIREIFCPECHGTGVRIEGDKLESARYPDAKMYNFKMKAMTGQKEYMKRPEALQNCSTGIYFPPQSEDTAAQEKVTALKLLHFYSADA